MNFCVDVVDAGIVEPCRAGRLTTKETCSLKINRVIRNMCLHTVRLTAILLLCDFLSKLIKLGLIQFLAKRVMLASLDVLSSWLQSNSHHQNFRYQYPWGHAQASQIEVTVPLMFCNLQQRF